MTTNTHELLAKLAIRDLIELSSDAINRQDWSALLGLMQPDILWERRPPTPWRLEGLDAVRDFLLGNAAKIDILHYAVTGTVVDLEPDGGARVRSTMREVIRVRQTGARLLVVGAYHDHLVPIGDGWRFASRIIEPRWEDDLPAPARLFGALGDVQQRFQLATAFEQGDGDVEG